MSYTRNSNCRFIIAEVPEKSSVFFEICGYLRQHIGLQRAEDEAEDLLVQFGRILQIAAEHVRDKAEGDEARTRYLHLGKVALYRMSYTRIMVPPVGVEPTTRGFSVRCSTY